MDFKRITSLQISGRPVQWLAISGRQVWTAEEPVNYLTFESQQAVSTLKLVANGSPDQISLEYRTDDGEWQSYTIGQQLSLLNGRHVQFRGDNTRFGKSTSAYYRFQMTGKIAASGSTMTLIDKTDTKRDVPTYCFFGLFDGCTALTQAPTLPATTVADWCYRLMFNGCTSLTQAPELPATTAYYSCYSNMFSGCTALTQAPELPATTLNTGSYESMFSGCTALTEAPELPATTLGTQCYKSMFTNCTALTQAPALPATTLTNVCYYGMFQGCTSLTQAPELPATTLVNQCYYSMFNGCSNLSNISVKFTAWHSNATDYWVSGVASTGEFHCPIALSEERGTSRIPSSWTIVKPINYLTLTALQNSSTIALNAVGTPDPINLEYRTNHEDIWHPYTIGDTLSMMSGWTLELRGDNATFSKSAGSYYKFAMTGSYAASGSIMTLLDKTNTRRDVLECGFYRLFDSTSLTQAPELPATTLASSCYASMFQDCTSLTQAPELPATALAYGCYQNMFQNCSVLTQAPELPATTLASYCYNSMFKGCASLTKAPELPATALVDHSYYNMFSGCTSLTKAPELPATTLADECYSYMFYGCSNLNNISVKFTQWPADSTTNWVNGVASTGTFNRPAALPNVRGASNIPEGWTVETKIKIDDFETALITDTRGYQYLSNGADIANWEPSNRSLIGVVDLNRTSIFANTWNTGKGMFIQAASGNSTEMTLSMPTVEAGTYILEFDCSKRPATQTPHVSILIDETEIASFNPENNDKEHYTSNPINLSGDKHILTVRATSPGGDSSAIFDNFVLVLTVA